MAESAETWAKRWKRAAKNHRAEEDTRAERELVVLAYRVAQWEARAERWKVSAGRERFSRKLHEGVAASWRDAAYLLGGRVAELTRERDEARAALLRRMDKDDRDGA